MLCDTRQKRRSVIREDLLQEKPFRSGIAQITSNEIFVTHSFSLIFISKLRNTLYIGLEFSTEI